MNDITKRAMARIGLNYPLTMADASPKEKYSSGGVTVTRESYRSRLFDFSVLNVSAMLGIISAELIILNPTVKDAPCVMAGFIHSPGKDSLHMEALNTQLKPICPDTLIAVRNNHPEPKDHYSSLNWYEDLKLPGCICRSLKPQDREAQSMFTDWLDAYFRLLDKAEDCDAGQKYTHTLALVDQFILKDNDTVSMMYSRLGREQAQRIIHKAFFPTAD